ILARPSAKKNARLARTKATTRQSQAPCNRCANCPIQARKKQPQTIQTYGATVRIGIASFSRNAARSPQSITLEIAEIWQQGAKGKCNHGFSAKRLLTRWLQLGSALLYTTVHKFFCGCCQIRLSRSVFGGGNRRFL